MTTTVLLNAQPVEILNVHLKAGCSEGDDAEACSTLFEQIPYLTAYAASQNDKGIPILIGGDFNRRLSQRGDEAMNTLGFNEQLGLKIMSHEGVSKCSLQDKAAIDYQIVSQSFTDLTKSVDAYEYAFTGPFENWPSDHCPNVVKYNF
ncbi:endonuclease/exonuclease/phosphatase family protein [Paracoccus seriniphilus]|uniref:endonuclease/exonuclease/phosphatase family protein n=1 Tax=Paracoccus seriniphilus TaxID=184748 RepID=UPI00118156A9|nr:hypothetical protein [Paracoccus seriniphilus]